MRTAPRRRSLRQHCRPSSPWTLQLAHPLKSRPSQVRQLLLLPLLFLLLLPTPTPLRRSADDRNKILSSLRSTQNDRVVHRALPYSRTFNTATLCMPPRPTHTPLRSRSR